MNFKSIIGAAMLLTLSAPTYAVIIGDLTSNPATNITVQISNLTRSYSRFDAFDLTYADTVAAVAPTGVFSSWSIATATEALQFITSAVYVTDQTGCLTDWCVDGWSDGAFGASFDGTADKFAYLSNPADLTEIGLVTFSTSGGVTSVTNAITTLTLDDLNLADNSAVNLLLFSNDPNPSPLAQPVPEPGILALLSLGLLGMGVRRFKAKG